MVLTVAAIVVYAQRNQVAKQIANSVIRDLGFEATRLSISELSRGWLRLDELVVVSRQGDRYVLEGVTLPSVPGKGGSYSADRLRIERSDEDRAAAAFGNLIDIVVNLPEALANTDIKISELQATDSLTLKNAAWSAAGSTQTVSFEFGELGINVELLTSESAARLLVGVERGDVSALTAELELDRVDGHYQAQGPATADARPWLGYLQSLDVVPKGADILDALFGGSLLLRFDDDGPGTILATAQLELTGEALFTFESATQTTLERPLSPTLTYRYPDNEWLARIETANLDMGVGDDIRLPVVLENVDCQLGIRCESRISVVDTDVRLADFAAESIDVRLDGVVDFVGGLRLTIADGASADLAGIQGPAFASDSLTLTTKDAGEAMMVDDRWHWSVGELQLFADNLETVPNLLVSFPATLSELRFHGGTRMLTSRLVIPPDVRGNWKGNLLALPGLEGNIEFSDARGKADLELTDNSDALTGSATWQEDRLKRQGSLSVDGLVADFSRKTLSDYVSGLPGEMDIVRGTWSLNGGVSYESASPETVYQTNASHTLADLAGRVGDTVLAGVSGQFDTRFDAEAASATGKLMTRLLEVGIPVENLQSAFTADLRQQSVQFDSVSAEALGGTATAEPFTWHASGEPVSTILHLDTIQLPLIVGLLDFDQLELKGSVSGALPIQIAGMNVTIEDGMIESEAPGGVIRYDAGAATTETPASGLGFVNEALRNFEFDSLTSTVGYGESGDLELLMRLTGISPDIDPLQPVILNLSVENNVPQMLRSLRAVRSIQDILEQGTTQ